MRNETTSSHKDNPRGNSSGFSLVQMLVGIGVSSILLTGFLSYFSNVQNQMQRDRLMATRDHLLRQVQASLFNPKSYSYTIGRNDQINKSLAICLFGDQSNPENPAQCEALAAAALPNDQGFALYSPGATTPVSGPKGQPAYFNLDGQNCTGPEAEKCPLQVETWFQASCSVGAACGKASDLSLFYSVSTSPSSKYSLKSIANITTPIAYSTVMGNHKPGAYHEDDALTADAGSSGASAGPNISCTTRSYTVQKPHGASFRDELEHQTTCCMAAGTSIVCKALSGAGGALDFSNDFGKWVPIAFRHMGSCYSQEHGGITPGGSFKPGSQWVSLTRASGNDRHIPECPNVSLPCTAGTTCKQRVMLDCRDLGNYTGSTSMNVEYACQKQN